jgi:RNA polymerase sigma-70 factor (ECF subfamily)
MTEITRATQDLIDRAGRGDEDARRDLLERYRDYLRRMVAARLDRLLAPRLDPSDILQESLAETAARMEDYLRNPRSRSSAGCG